MHYHNINGLCDDLQFELEYVDDCTDYIVNGQNCELDSCTILRMRMFISWMLTRKRKPHFNFLLCTFFPLHQDFTKLRQEDRIRFLNEQAASTPSTTKLPPSHTSRNKTRPVFLYQPVDILDEPNCDSTKAILLEKDEHDPTKAILLEKDEYDPSPSPTVKSATNLLGTKRAFTRVHSTFPEDSKKLIIEEHKDVKMIPSTQHSTIGNHQPIPQPKPVHFPDICHSLDEAPQDVDKSHLSDSTSTMTNLNETCSLDTSCDYLLHLDSPSLSSEQQDNSIVKSTEAESVPDFEDLLQLDSTSVSSQDTSSIEIEFVSESEGQLDNANLSPSDVFLEHHD